MSPSMCMDTVMTYTVVDDMELFVETIDAYLMVCNQERFFARADVSDKDGERYRTFKAPVLYG